MTNRTTITAAMIAATITSVSWPASAAMTRTELQELCRPISMATRNWAQIADLGKCTHYIIGVLETASWFNRHKPDTCIPPETERHPRTGCAGLPRQGPT